MSHNESTPYSDTVVNLGNLNARQDLLGVCAYPVEEAVFIEVTLVGEGQAGHWFLQLLHKVECVSLKVVPLLCHHLEQVALKVGDGGQRLHLEALPRAVNQGSLPRRPLQPEANTTGEDLHTKQVRQNSKLARFPPMPYGCHKHQAAHYHY